MTPNLVAAPQWAYAGSHTVLVRVGIENGCLAILSAIVLASSPQCSR